MSSLTFKKTESGVYTLTIKGILGEPDYEYLLLDKRVDDHYEWYAVVRELTPIPYLDDILFSSEGDSRITELAEKLEPGVKIQPILKTGPDVYETTSNKYVYMSYYRDQTKSYRTTAYHRKFVLPIDSDKNVSKIKEAALKHIIHKHNLEVKS